MITIRPLDSSNPDDHVQLEILLNDYIDTSTKTHNRTYNSKNAPGYANWLKEQFKHHVIEDFIIYGKFENNILYSIIVGYKLEVRWGKKTHEITNTLPYWCFGLVYFKNTEWNSPSARFGELTNGLVRNFEKQGYYKIYMVKKTPYKVHVLEDVTTYVKLESWLKLLPGLDRYSTTIEKIFFTQQDVDDFKKKFKAISSIIPPEINKSIMLLSFVLKPNTPFKT